MRAVATPLIPRFAFRGGKDAQTGFAVVRGVVGVSVVQREGCGDHQGAPSVVAVDEKFTLIIAAASASFL